MFLLSYLNLALLFIRKGGSEDCFRFTKDNNKCEFKPRVEYGKPQSRRLGGKQSQIKIDLSRECMLHQYTFSGIIVSNYSQIYVIFCNGNCNDGTQNQDETGVNCGGACSSSSCQDCSGGIKNQDETGVELKQNETKWNVQ